MTHFTARLIATLTIVIVIGGTAESGAGAVASVSADPKVTVSGGTAESHRKLEAALRTFRDAGLELPDLAVSLSADEADCGGTKGRFRDSTTPWEISICSNGDAVYEHELAHAWERGNLTDGQRSAFMELRGYEVWSSAEIPWNERGVEGVAFVIQQGLAGVPLSPVLSDEAQSRMEAYEFLTGTPAPRLARWLMIREIPCTDRPTPLSRPLQDQTGLTC